MSGTWLSACKFQGRTRATWHHTQANAWKSLGSSGSERLWAFLNQNTHMEFAEFLGEILLHLLTRDQNRSSTPEFWLWVHSTHGDFQNQTHLNWRRQPIYLLSHTQNERAAANTFRKLLEALKLKLVSALEALKSWSSYPCLEALKSWSSYPCLKALESWSSYPCLEALKSWSSYPCLEARIRALKPWSLEARIRA